VVVARPTPPDVLVDALAPRADPGTENPICSNVGTLSIATLLAALICGSPAPTHGLTHPGMRLSPVHATNVTVPIATTAVRQQCSVRMHHLG
jgi:hypothetical protein